MQELSASACTPDDDEFTQAFEQCHHAAQTALNDLTPTEVLGEFLPAVPSIAATTVETLLSPHSSPTSMSIHNEAAADVSDNATRGSTEIDYLLWGMGHPLISLSSPSGLESIKVSHPGRKSERRALDRLATRRQGCILFAGMFCLIMSIYLTYTTIRGPMLAALTSSIAASPPNTTFEATYFHTLQVTPKWKRHLMAINGSVWLYSLCSLVVSFRGMLSGGISNRAMQISLLKATFVWLAYSGVDGMLRLRSREEISLSMMPILMLMLVLSTISKNLTA